MKAESTPERAAVEAHFMYSDGDGSNVVAIIFSNKKSRTEVLHLVEAVVEDDEQIVTDRETVFDSFEKRFSSDHKNRAYHIQENKDAYDKGEILGIVTKTQKD